MIPSAPWQQLVAAAVAEVEGQQQALAPAPVAAPVWPEGLKGSPTSWDADLCGNVQVLTLLGWEVRPWQQSSGLPWAPTPRCLLEVRSMPVRLAVAAAVASLGLVA